MKTTIIIFFFLSTYLLPLAISYRPPFIRLPDEADIRDYAPVLDIDGNPVIAGARYNLTFVTYGGLGIVSVANFKYPDGCPTHVFLNISMALPGIELPLGPPVSLYPIGRDVTDEVLEVVPLNVEFYEPDLPNRCANLTVWKLDDNDRVVTGGVKGDEDVKNRFSIRKVSCEIGTIHCYVFRGNGGIGTIDDLRRLGINDNSLTPLSFVKVAD